MSDFTEKINQIIEENISDIEDEKEKNNKITQIYEFAINKMAKSIKNNLDDNSKNILSRENRIFEKKNNKIIKKTWRKVFDILDDIIEITQESMESYFTQFNEIANKENNLVYHAIRTIHTRVVLCFKECLILLKNGYSEGATKIWRTMYELTIVASFIRKHSNDNELVQRYIDHIIIDNYKEESEYRKQSMTRQHYTDNAFIQMEKEYDIIIAKYGKSFKKDFGWASKILNKDNLTLYDLELDIKNTKHHPYYKSSCFAIHSNYKGNVDKIGLINNNVLLYGPSDYGLSIPCQNIAIILNQINLEFFTIYFSLDYYVAIYTINLYLDELLPLADKTQEKLKNNQS